MDPSIVTGLAAVVGSLTGAFAAIATTWINVRSQRIREHAKLEMVRREGLYRDFITEAAHLVADAFEHSLERPETLVKLYASLARIRLIASALVLDAAEECCGRIVEMYAKPNRRAEEFSNVLRSHELDFFKHFSDVCRAELEKYSNV